MTQLVYQKICRLQYSVSTFSDVPLATVKEIKITNNRLRKLKTGHDYKKAALSGLFYFSIQKIILLLDKFIDE